MVKKGRDVQQEWGPAQDQALRTIKEKFKEAPKLRHPNYNEDFILHSDASDYAIGGCLVQRNKLTARN